MSPNGRWWACMSVSVVFISALQITEDCWGGLSHMRQLIARLAAVRLCLFDTLLCSLNIGMREFIFCNPLWARSVIYPCLKHYFSYNDKLCQHTEPMCSSEALIAVLKATGRRTEKPAGEERGEIWRWARSCWTRTSSTLVEELHL